LLEDHRVGFGCADFAGGDDLWQIGLKANGFQFPSLLIGVAVGEDAQEQVGM
jgi:hypothetical protein